MRPRIPSPAKAGDFRWFAVSHEPRALLSASAKEWLVAEQARQNLETLVASAGLEFAQKLFSRLRLAGILHCEITTRYESDREWLVFAKAATTPSRAIALDDVVGSRCGEFVFLPLSRLIEFRSVESMLADLSLTLLQRFFAHFGGLRISMPHLGGTFFLQHPQPCPRAMLAARRATSRWQGASSFYAIDHCDYLILNEQGEVGYLPLEPDQPIRHHADSFESFLDQWLVELG